MKLKMIMNWFDSIFMQKKMTDVNENDDDVKDGNYLLLITYIGKNIRCNQW